MTQGKGAPLIHKSTEVFFNEFTCIFTIMLDKERNDKYAPNIMDKY